MSNFRRAFVIIVFFFPPIALAEPLWNNWYVETENELPKSYYNEKTEILGDRVKIQLNRWIREGKKIRSENLGATAKNSPLLEPLLYNFRTQQNNEEKVIDGTVSSNGKVFSVKTKVGIQSSRPLRAEMIPKLILSSFFPVWIHKNYKRINGVQPIEFQTIIEDQVEEEVPVVRGSAYEMRADEFAKQTHSRKLRIEFNRIVAFWWVSEKGDAIQITVPELKKTVKKVDKKTAEAFLNP